MTLTKPDRGRKSPPHVWRDTMALWLSLMHWVFDGTETLFLESSHANKRALKFVMNGLLMTEGIDAISIPAVRATQSNSRIRKLNETPPVIGGGTTTRKKPTFLPSEQESTRAARYGAAAIRATAGWPTDVC